MKNISGIAHVAIKVTDLDRSLEFYVDKLGFPEMMRLHKDDGSTWLVYLRITDTQYLEIFPGAENDRAPGWDANGVNHICLESHDLKGLLKEIGDAGIPLLMPFKFAVDNNWQAWIEDPDGNRIELMQMGPDSLQLEAIARLRGEMAPA
jgi:lactoylglutathione lyase